MPKIDPSNLRIGLVEIRREIASRSPMECTIKHMVTGKAVANCMRSRSMLRNIKNSAMFVRNAVTPILGDERTLRFLRNLVNICDYYIIKTQIEQDNIRNFLEGYQGRINHIGRGLSKQRLADKTTKQMVTKINSMWKQLGNGIKQSREHPEWGKPLDVLRIEGQVNRHAQMLTGPNGFMMHPR